MVIDDVILFSNIQFKKVQTGLYRANDFFLMLKSVVIRSDVAAQHIFKSLILADYSSIGETAKLISSILKELTLPLSRSSILGRSLGAACTSDFISNGWTSQSSKIWIDASLKLLRQCESLTLLSDVGQGFFSAISNVSHDFRHEWLSFCVDVLVIVQFLRFEFVSVEARDSVVSKNNPKCVETL